MKNITTILGVALLAILVVSPVSALAAFDDYYNKCEVTNEIMLGADWEACEAEIAKIVSESATIALEGNNNNQLAGVMSFFGINTNGDEMLNLIREINDARTQITNLQLELENLEF